MFNHVGSTCRSYSLSYAARLTQLMFQIDCSKTIPSYLILVVVLKYIIDGGACSKWCIFVFDWIIMTEDYISNMIFMPEKRSRFINDYDSFRSYWDIIFLGLRVLIEAERIIEYTELRYLVLGVYDIHSFCRLHSCL